MAAKDTGDQRRKTREPDETEEAPPAEGGEDTQERHEKLTDDVDDLLEDIDDVLEENAEEFVRSYVQKGGE